MTTNQILTKYLDESLREFKNKLDKSQNNQANDTINSQITNISLLELIRKKTMLSHNIIKIYIMQQFLNKINNAPVIDQSVNEDLLECLIFDELMAKKDVSESKFIHYNQKIDKIKHKFYNIGEFEMVDEKIINITSDEISLCWPFLLEYVNDCVYDAHITYIISDIEHDMEHNIFDMNPLVRYLITLNVDGNNYIQLAYHPEDGFLVQVNENSNVVLMANYNIENCLHGYLVKYDGHVLSQISEYLNGSLNGETYYFSNTFLLMSCPFKNDLAHGRLKIYDHTQSSIYEEFYFANKSILANFS